MSVELASADGSVGYTARRQGVGIAIVHAETGMIWTHRELQEKSSTGRRAGEVSVPFETAKPQELDGNRATVLGGLAEVYNDVDTSGKPIMPTLAGEIFSMDPGVIATRAALPFGYNGSAVRFHMAVLIDNGPQNRPITPVDSAEVAPVGWMSVEEFLAPETNARPLARYGIEVLNNGILQERLDRFLSDPDSATPIFTSDFSLGRYFEEREKVHDMDPSVEYSFV